ncbi:A disintegrin and metalloproteinase with thrombospondin motifs adt-2-like [Anopheles ziemanni]|uniref:A disintegrin and metalloproteinase with thrombospondin motifs adt-2-like n=1 Tax=Anopheles coustani TaxID=139045 RepID=UPI00265A4DF5|nr:A disintegrin and metalloproteinase with thrombospondin motifs adt-2-like [Anopheles coustani]XP_058177598.1 A disintegrin and metalloproteinase with thrombospondin motifs adt-2-like [Anopheles ziemanni]
MLHTCGVTVGVLVALTVGTIVPGLSGEPSDPKQLFVGRLGSAERLQYFGSESESDWPYFELVDVDVRHPDGSGHRDVPDFNLSFSFRNDPIVLRLQPNRALNATNVPVTVLTAGQERVTKVLEGTPRPSNFVAHFVHNDGNTTAALSTNGDDKFSGIIFHTSGPLEITPLDVGLLDRQTSSVFRRPHLVKDLRPQTTSDVSYELLRRRTQSEIHLLGDTLGQKNYSSTELEELDARDGRNRSAPTRYGRPKLELAVFFDEAAYNTFAPYLDHNDAALRDFLLAYINGIQALYHHPSLGQGVDVTLVYLELMRTQPPEMPHYDGERNLLLDSFCAYQSALNQGRWDMGLYLSGLDFYSIDNGRRNGGTMGLATVGGVCLSDYACVIAEFGARNIFGKPYPSSGFTSVFIAAHEIGHNLGMHHDSVGNGCPKDGFVMSPSRGTQGETTWSTCSADVISQLNWAGCLFETAANPKEEYDTSKFYDHPGQAWTAKRQCEVLLTDKDAILASAVQPDICQNLRCRTPHRTGFYFAGPALEGTDCGDSKWCNGGKCIKQKKKPTNSTPGGWGGWMDDECISGCLEQSRGYKRRTRRCDNPPPVNTDQGCEGVAVDVTVCDDQQLCHSNREPVQFYASRRCREFSQLLPRLDPVGRGIQGPYDSKRLWMSCAIYCKRADNDAYYAPRFDLNDLGVDSYFPDGTLCHQESGTNYYCQQHHCLPENFKTSKISIWSITEDIPVAGNALPMTSHFLDSAILSYLSLDRNITPLTSTWALKPDQLPNDDQWVDQDYLDLTGSFKTDVDKPLEGATT